MAKDTFYFSHDYNPTADPKIQALIGVYKAEGYGIYWRIVEMLHSDENHKLELKKYIYIAISTQMSTPVEQVEAIVQDCINVFELFDSDGITFWSNRAFRNIKIRSELSSKRSKAGKISAEKRKNATRVEQVSTHVEHISTNCNKGKERKEKEIKEKEIERENTPPPEKNRFLIEIEELENYLISQEQWIDVICMQNKIDKGGAADLIRKFVEKLKSENVKDKTPADACSHFANWLKYELQKINTNGRNKSVNKEGTSWNDLAGIVAGAFAETGQ